MINEWFIFHLYKVSKRKCACLVDLLFFLPFHVPLQSSLSKPCILRTKKPVFKIFCLLQWLLMRETAEISQRSGPSSKIRSSVPHDQARQTAEKPRRLVLRQVNDWLVKLTTIYIWRNNRFCLTWRLKDKACLTADRMANRMTGWQTNWMTGSCKQFDYERLTHKPSFLKSFRSCYWTLINVIFFFDWLTDCSTDWQTYWRTNFFYMGVLPLSPSPPGKWPTHFNELTEWPVDWKQVMTDKPTNWSTADWLQWMVARLLTESNQWTTTAAHIKRALTDYVTDAETEWLIDWETQCQCNR